MVEILTQIPQEYKEININEKSLLKAKIKHASLYNIKRRKSRLSLKLMPDKVNENLYRSEYHEYTYDFHFAPGESLSDVKLNELFSDLIEVNINSKIPIVHKALNPNQTLEQVREKLSHFLVAVCYLDGLPAGFAISPFFKEGGKTLMHIGLIVISRNIGRNIMSFGALGIFYLAQKKLGRYYISNITSTPSALEVISKMVPNCWPSPLVSNKKPPKDYYTIIDLLYRKYLLQYFPNPDKIEVDLKRFIMRSTSEDMGFNTNFHEISRACDFKFNLFCNMWIDYDKEEDIIQIGKVGKKISLKIKIFFGLLRLISMLRK